MRPLALAAVAILLGLAPLAAADFVPFAQLQAPNLRASGLAEAAGAARALVYRSLEDTDNAHFTLALQADRLHVETDHAQILAEPAGVEINGALWTDTKDYSNATARLQSARPHFKVEILGIPGHAMQVTASSTCLDLLLPSEAEVHATKFTPAERQPPATSTDGAIQILPCKGTIEAAGSFVLVLWEATLGIDSPAGHAVAHSGRGKSTTQGPYGPLKAGEFDRSSQIYATVTQGSLRLELAPDADGDLAAYMLEPSLLIHGALQATGATGSMTARSGQISQVPSDVALQGDMTALSRRAPDGVLAQVRGEPDGLKVNGATFLIASAAADPALRHGWTFLGAAVLLAAVVVAVWARWQPGPRKPLRIRVAGHLVDKKYPSALLWLAYGLQFRFSDGDTLALRAAIQFALGRNKQAYTWAKKADGVLTDPECSAANALVASLAAARLHWHGEAGRWFVVAVQLDSRLGAVLSRDRKLRRSWASPRFQRWMRVSAANEFLQA